MTAATRSLRRAAHARGRGARRAATPARGSTGPAAVLPALIAVLAGIGAGAAWGGLRAQEQGSRVTVVGKILPVVVLPSTGTVDPRVHPGSRAPLRLRLTNPNGAPVLVVGLAERGTAVTVRGGTGCSSATAGVRVPARRNLHIPLPRGRHVVVVPTGVQMSADSASGCQGASMSIAVTVTVEPR